MAFQRRTGVEIAAKSDECLLILALDHKWQSAKALLVSGTVRPDREIVGDQRFEDSTRLRRICLFCTVCRPCTLLAGDCMEWPGSVGAK